MGEPFEGTYLRPGNKLLSFLFFLFVFGEKFQVLHSNILTKKLQQREGAV